MNEEIRWQINDKEVEELRKRMIKARGEFRNKNPFATEEAEEKFLSNKFKDETQLLMKEQMNIISLGFRSKTEKYLY